MKSKRHLHLVGAIGQIRTATYDNREHLVVPVVAMVEGVVWAVNSDVPEFVSAYELAQTPQQWNGRGCFAGHPEDNGSQITANTPRTLEKSFGVIFDTYGADRILATRRLEFNAWIDAEKAERVSTAAANVVKRLRALRDKQPNAQPVEVSVGCYVEAEDVDGEFNGQAYHGAWKSIVSDHLAFLAEGEQGACSVAAGCGAGRMARRHHVIKANDIVSLQVLDRQGKPIGLRGPTAPLGVTMPDLKQPIHVKLNMMEQFRRMVSKFKGAETDVSDRDLRQKVDAALRAVEPGYIGINEIYPDGTADMAMPHAIYDVCPADEWKIMRRGYTLSADGSIALDATAQHIEPVTTYEVVTAAAAAKPCACGGQPRQASAQPTEKEKENKMKERIAALAAHSFSTIKDVKVLESIASLNADAFKALEDKADADKAAADKAAADKIAADKAEADKKAADEKDKPTTAAAKPMTRDEMLAAMPDVKSLLDERAAREAAEKTELITKLKAASTVLTEEQLKTRSIDELRTLAAFAKVESTVDYSGRGAAVPPKAPAGVETYAPPNAYDADLKALKEKTTVN